MVSVFQSIPQSLELASSILVFLYSLDEFPGSLLIGAPYVKTLSVFMYNTAMGYEMQIASVTSILLTIPGIVMLLVTERYIKVKNK